jgi:hypothetical protein
MNKTFLEALKANNWKEISNDWEYGKGDWLVLRDTGSWWIITNKKTNFRGLDFPDPTDTTAVWTVNLIEHLCKLYDQGSVAP